MEKFFNTAGPIVQDIHYYVDVKTRWDFSQVISLIKGTFNQMVLWRLF